MKKDYKCREDEFLSEESFDILCEPAIARPKKESIGKYVNLYCKTDDGSKIIVELQNDPQKHFVDRAIYYSTFPVQAQIERGDPDYILCPIYVVSILDFTLRELEGDKDILSIFRLKELNTWQRVEQQIHICIYRIGQVQQTVAQP